MPTIHLTTIINAPIETCFDVARDVDVHQLSTSQTKEKAIAGRTSGLCEKGDVITWEAIHFGIKQKLTVCITEMEKYSMFEDEMTKGAFAYMKHKHQFDSVDEGTRMTDEFVFKAPFGILGRIAEKLFLTSYMTKFLLKRNRLLKSLAESKSK